jgi:hypothetical protein
LPEVDEMMEKYDKSYSSPEEEEGGYRANGTNAATAYRADQDVFGDEADAEVRSS